MNDHAEHTGRSAAPLLNAQELRYVQLMCERKAWLQKELPLQMNLTKKQVAWIQQNVFDLLGIHSHHELISRTRSAVAAHALGFLPSALQH